MASVALGVDGMTCGGCVASISQALKARPGVAGVTASLEDGQVLIQYDPQTIDVTALQQAIQSAGFEVRALPAE